MMDDDKHAEGWQSDVIYPPCPKNPDRCRSCDGSGEAGPEVTTQDDCPACNGTGWKDGKVRWPIPADLPISTRVLARMHRAHQRGTGCRLSADDLNALATELAGQWMSEAAEKDYLLVATVFVGPDGSTSCNLNFGRGVGFSVGKVAIDKAALALRSEIEESHLCPASRRRKNI